MPLGNRWPAAAYGLRLVGWALSAVGRFSGEQQRLKSFAVACALVRIAIAALKRAEASEGVSASTRAEIRALVGGLAVVEDFIHEIVDGDGENTDEK